MAGFMFESSLGIVTYTIDVDLSTTGQGPGWTAILRACPASVPENTPVSSTRVSGQQISDALNKTSEIQAGQRVRVGQSARQRQYPGTYLDQVVYRHVPRIRCLSALGRQSQAIQLGEISGALKLEDADSNAAINSNTGLITECARSFWTPLLTATDTYWTFNPQGGAFRRADPPQISIRIPNADGNVVEKGAQATCCGACPRPRHAHLKTCSPTFASCTGVTG